MHQTTKGHQWYFGMKAHFGVDGRTKLIHAAVVTPANVADSGVPSLLHGKETRLWGDQAYRGQRAVIRCQASRAQGRASDRDHQAGFAKVHYRGLKKNAHRLLVSCALAT
jgi:IS5 family transposase